MEEAVSISPCDADRPTIAPCRARAKRVWVRLSPVVPTETARETLETLDRSAAAVGNIVRVPSASVKPSGDPVLCDVAREQASVDVAQPRRLGLARDGWISTVAADARWSAVDL